MRRRTDPDWAATALRDGEVLRVADQWATGLGILAALRRQIPRGASGDDFAGQRSTRARYQAASSRLLVTIRGHRLALKKAPEIGWLHDFYPDLHTFMLPFPQVQGLNSSWQWHQRGVRFPVLDRTFRPLHGVYFPTRFDHLHLFQDWLGSWAGPRQTAVDVGTGCGVLAWMLREAGFDHVHATDINPNAVESLRRELATAPRPTGIVVEARALLGSFGAKANVIAFNPPWLPGPVLGPLDGAIYYPAGLFEDFFTEARARVAPGGRVVVLFSNLITIAQRSGVHPLEHELTESDRFTLVQRHERAAAPSSRRTRRRRRSTRQERVELWELAPR